ncbi:MAG TPA: ABC transporter permease, partial [Clostridia bacterium]|nr:ABC transporter permease [Clostridia bacterium]
MFENIRLSFHGIWGHKLRSGLTMLGIIIGIASIISIVSTIKGTNDQIKQNLIGAGNNSVVIQLYEGDYPVDMSYFSLPDGIPVVSDEVQEEIAGLSEVANVALFTQRSAYDTIFRGNTSLSGGWLKGVDNNYFEAYGYRVTRGRGFVEDDFKENRKVVILDASSASSLFLEDDPIDKTIEIMGEPFVVIGLTEQSSSFKPVINSIEDYYT